MSRPAQKRRETTPTKVLACSSVILDGGFVFTIEPVRRGSLRPSPGRVLGLRARLLGF